MTGDAKILPCGEQALTVELSRSIDEAVNRRVIALARDLEASPPEGLVELVPTYRSLLVRYDPLLTNGAAMTAELQARLAQTGKGESAKGGRLWHLPVLYGGEIGLDLDDLAKDKGLSREELIRISYGGGISRLYDRLRPRICLSRRLAGDLAYAPAEATPRGYSCRCHWHWRCPGECKLGNRPFRLALYRLDPGADF